MKEIFSRKTATIRRKANYKRNIFQYPTSTIIASLPREPWIIPITTIEKKMQRKQIVSKYSSISFSQSMFGVKLHLHSSHTEWGSFLLLLLLLLLFNTHSALSILRLADIFSVVESLNGSDKESNTNTCFCYFKCRKLAIPTKHILTNTRSTKCFIVFLAYGLSAVRARTNISAVFIRLCFYTRLIITTNIIEFFSLCYITGCVLLLYFYASRILDASALSFS